MRILSRYFKLSLILAAFGFFIAPAYAIYYDFAKGLTFDTIDCMGNIKLIIHQVHGRKDNVVVAPKSIRVKVRQHALLIRELYPTPNREPAVVKVRLNQLNKLSTYGLTSVVGRVNSEHLNIRAENHSAIHLNGLIALRELVTDGRAKVNITDLNSQKLAVVARGDSKVHLSGRAINMVARLRQYAKLNAQELKVKKVLVQAKGFSRAMVFPVDSLRAFATHRSNIYYLKKPKHISRNTSGSGNILQIAWKN